MRCTPRSPDGGNGVGTQLLVAAEQEARQRGCVKVTVDTHSFQAPEFYRRHGYVEVGSINDYPAGYSYHFFRKPLD